MELERDVLVSPRVEVPVIYGELVTAIRTLAGRGVGKSDRPRGRRWLSSGRWDSNSPSRMAFPPTCCAMSVASVSGAIT